MAFEVDGVVPLLKVDRGIVYELNRDRSLMVGTGGWSFTLMRLEAAKMPGDRILAAH